MGEHAGRGAVAAVEAGELKSSCESFPVSRLAKDGRWLGAGRHCQCKQVGHDKTDEREFCV